MLGLRLPGMLFLVPLLVHVCCCFPVTCKAEYLMSQDPFATKEVYHDGPFAQFMINTFSNRMSSLLGGEPLLLLTGRSLFLSCLRPFLECACALHSAASAC